MKLILVGLLTLSSTTQAKSVSIEMPDYRGGYREQAAEMSDQHLIDALASPTYSWLWIKPRHVLAEVKVRGNQSSARAGALLVPLMYALDRREPSADYVTEAFIKLLPKAQAGRTMSEEALRLLVDLNYANRFEGEISYSADRFIRNDLTLDPAEMSADLKLHVLQRLPRRYASSQRLNDLVLKLAISLAKDAERAPFVADVMRERDQFDGRTTFLREAVNANQQPIVSYCAKTIKFTNVLNEDDYLKLSTDIEIVTKFGSRDAVASIADKLKVILAELERRRARSADILAGQMVNSGSGGETGGGGYGTSSSDSLLTSFANGYGRVGGTISGARFVSATAEFLSRADLSVVIGRVADALGNACHRAAETSDREVVRFCINSLVPTLLKNEDVRSRVETLIKRVILDAGSSYDGTSFRLSCHAFDVDRESQEELKILEQLRGLDLKMEVGIFGSRDGVLPVRAEVCDPSPNGLQTGTSELPPARQMLPSLFSADSILSVRADGQQISLCTDRLNTGDDKLENLRQLVTLNTSLVRSNGRIIPAKLLWQILSRRENALFPSSLAFRGYARFAVANRILREGTDEKDTFDRLCRQLNPRVVTEGPGPQFIDYRSARTKHPRPLARTTI